MSTGTMTTPAETQLGVRVEVWPVAADPEGIWLLSEGDDGQPDAWRSDAIPVAGGCHAAVEDILRAHPGRGARQPGPPPVWAPVPTPDAGSCLGDVQLLHSTSWRPDDDAMIVTYLAVLGGQADGEYAVDVWPHAKPVSLELANDVGKPAVVPAVDPPLPRDIDVLFHGLRHLRYLLDYDRVARDALDGHWRTHLTELQLALAGMYRD